MIVLDTNIISELVKTEPDKRVFQWFDTLDQPVFLTSITIGELQRGVMNLPDGKRKQNLIAVVDNILDEYKDHILGYDTSAALAYGLLCSVLKSKGVGVGQADAMIAAITLLHDATLSTRNEKDFLHCGIKVVNPF